MRVLQFTTYSLSELDHGGKIRSYYIKEGISKFSHLETMSFSWEESDTLNGFEVTISAHRYAESGGHHFLGDIAIVDYLITATELYASIANKVNSYKPTHVLIEQPFLWPVVERLIEDGYLSREVKVIYSSHNIEYLLKRKIYSDLFPEEEARSLTERVRNIEINLAKRADLILSVSQQEYDFLSNVNDQVPIVIVHNGNNTADDDSLTHVWKDKFQVEDGANWIFVGSWHPPNINGLLDLQERLLQSSEKSTFKIWVLGSVANGVKADNRWIDSKSLPFELVGPVSIQDLDGAIRACDGIVLPIWEGAGSNLKTSQALISRKKVIATEFSFRGFEEFKDEEGVVVVETAAEFVSALRDAQSSNEFVREKSEASLTWNGILNKFVNDSDILKFFQGKF